MPAWLQPDWCSSFVLALGHFLWQGALIAVVLAIALRATRTVSVRYWLSLAALMVMAMSPVVTLVWLLRPMSHVVTLAAPPIVREEPAPSPPIIPAAPFEETSNVGHVSNVPVIPPIASRDLNSTAPISPQPPADDRSWWQKCAPQLTTTYLCGVALMLLRLVFGLWGGRRLRRRVHLIDDPSLLAAMRRQATALGLKLLPVLAYCERVTVPTVVGVLKPMILLPLTLTSGLSPEQMESVLAHELAHLRRCDHLVNLLQRVIESLLFFHPALWWVSHRIREEREHCCDDLVVACGAMPLDYAKSLLVVAELSRASALRRSVAAVSLLATGPQKPSHLRQRIARLLGESATPSLRVSPRALLLAIGIPLIAVIATIQSGASNQQPSRSDKDEPSQATEFSSKLRNGVTVKLVGVGFHPSEKREWWQADGSPLDKRPYEKFAGNPLYQDESRLADCREFALEIRGLPQDHFVMTRIDGGLKGRSVVLNELKEGVFFTKLKAGQFADEKTTSLVVGLSVDPLGPAQRIGPDGRKLAAVAMPPDAKLLDDLIQPLRVQSRDGGTVLVLKPLAPFLLHQKAEWRLVAIDSDGQETTSNSQSESAQELELGFKLPLARLARFEYRLRPLRHWVTFENVSLQLGKQTHVKVKAESLPDEKPRAGRGSPAPALDPTAGLPNSDEETNPPNNANGDLRSNPAAGSGDPRRAQEDDGVADLAMFVANVRKAVPQDWTVEHGGPGASGLSIDRRVRIHGKHFREEPDVSVYFAIGDFGMGHELLGASRLGYAYAIVRQDFQSLWPDVRKRIVEVLPKGEPAKVQPAKKQRPGTPVEGRIVFEDGSTVTGATIDGTKPVSETGEYQVEIEPNWDRIYFDLLQVKGWPTAKSWPREKGHKSEFLNVWIGDDGGPKLRRDIRLDRTQFRTVKLLWKGAATDARIMVDSYPSGEWLTIGAASNPRKKPPTLRVGREVVVKLRPGESITLPNVAPGDGALSLTILPSKQILVWKLHGDERDEQLEYDPRDTGAVEFRITGPPEDPRKSPISLDLSRNMPRGIFGLRTTWLYNPSDAYRSEFNPQSDSYRIQNLQPGKYQVSLFVDSHSDSLVPFTVRSGETTKINVPINDARKAKGRAGRGSPDPALDPTAGHPNSEVDTNKTNGDLRSNPAARSGDPRRARDNSGGPPDLWVLR